MVHSCKESPLSMEHNERKKGLGFPVGLGDILRWVLLHFCQRHWRDGTEKDVAPEVGQPIEDPVL